MSNISNLEDWNEVTRGLYRFVISAGACYEIHILYHAKETDILTAKSSAFITGDWNSKDGQPFFERECILSEQPLFECLKAVSEDYRKNVEESEE